MQSSKEMFGIPKRENPPRSEIQFFSSSITVSSNATFLFADTDLIKHTGNGLTWTNDSTNGTTIKVIEPGVYSIVVQVQDTGASPIIHISLNSVDGTAIQNNLATLVIARSTQAGNSKAMTLTATYLASPGDELRVFETGANTLTNSGFRVTKVSS